MLRTMCNGKIHRVKVTGANINYVGSITIDPVLMKAAGILPYERVQVVNLNNGARFETYTMEGKPDSGEIIVNGAAARLVCPGDIVIIMSYVLMNEEECVGHKPKIAFVDEHNRLKE
jgi:aspartate 1-decarboxylase